MIHRRALLTTALTLGAMRAFPHLAYAQARPLVFATFTGSWEEAHKAVLVPAFRKATNNARHRARSDAVDGPDRQGVGARARPRRST